MGLKKYSAFLDYRRRWHKSMIAYFKNQAYFKKSSIFFLKAEVFFLTAIGQYAFLYAKSWHRGMQWLIHQNQAGDDLLIAMMDNQRVSTSSREVLPGIGEGIFSYPGLNFILANGSAIRVYHL